MLSKCKPSIRSIRSLSTISSPIASTSTLSKPTTKIKITTTNTISKTEIEHFSSLSSHWWNPIGEFSLLHRMNPVRVKFLKESLLNVKEFEIELEIKNRWLEGKKVLDVGCGGGIFAEALSRLGANTLAIDAAPINIIVAKSHAALDPSFPTSIIPNSIPSSSSASSSSTTTTIPTKTKNLLEYRHIPAEDLVKEGELFDVVCSMEVIEHVEDPTGFLNCLCDLTKPGGLILLSTISRTPFANLLTITLAEQVLKFITPGTHTYSKFIKPSELEDYFKTKGWKGLEIRGSFYDPLFGSWRLLGSGEWSGLGEQCNYFAGIRKPLE